MSRVILGGTICVFLISVVLSLCGCQTVKGLEMTAKGLAYDLGNSNTGAWASLKKADGWLQKNFW